MLRGDSTYEMEGSMMISEDSRQDNLLTAIAMVITDLLVVNENCSGDDRCYHPAAIPKGRDILNFVLKIKKYSKCSDSCFVVGLIYVDRVVNMHDFILTPQNVHRVYLTAVMLAAKFHEDIFYNNTFYAQLGEFTLKEINYTEVHLLSLLQFSLVVSGDIYDKYSRELCKYRARAKALACQPLQQTHQQAMLHAGLCTPLIPLVIPQALPPDQMGSPAAGTQTPIAQQVVYDFVSSVNSIPVAPSHAPSPTRVYAVSPCPSETACGGGMFPSQSTMHATPPPGLGQPLHISVCPVSGPVTVSMYPTIAPPSVHVLPMPMMPATVTPVLGSYAFTPADFNTSSPVHMDKSNYVGLPTTHVPEHPYF